MAQRDRLKPLAMSWRGADRSDMATTSLSERASAAIASVALRSCGRSPGSRTRMPSRRNCTPALTTMSPACRPPTIRTPSSPTPPTSTGVLRTTLFAASTTKTTVPPSLSVSAVERHHHRRGLIVDAERRPLRSCRAAWSAAARLRRRGPHRCARPDRPGRRSRECARRCCREGRPKA